jgi:hypothetical protein
MIVPGFRPVEYRKPSGSRRPASPTIRPINRRPPRKPARDFVDQPAALSDRQANFYQNLIGLALALRSRELPVDFETDDGRTWYLDRGCVKMAEHAGFIEELRNDEFGQVSSIRLAWSPTGSHGSDN